ncbi:MAG: M48 family metallopeptidase [Pseudomonadota bacterium]
MSVVPIKGKYYPAGSAAQMAATLLGQHDRYTIDTADGQSFYGLLTEIEVSPRLGNIERKLNLEDGSVFATTDNNAIDQLFRSQTQGSGFLHHLESKLSWVVVALVLTVFSGFAFFKWAVPIASHWIAHALPHETNQLIAANTLSFLDKYMFAESKLDSERQAAVRQHFFSQLVPLESDTDITYTLHFRRLGGGIPNAFALPSGDIILTDTFVNISENQQEIDSVLLHEMGHVAHRHSLQMVVQGAFVTVVVLMLTGDANALVDAGVGLGSILLSTGYSRNHESEADEYAFNKMLAAGIDPIHFSNILARMTGYMESKDPATGSEDEQQPSPDKPDNELVDYLSTHPKTQDRIDQAKRYSRCFQQGLKTCR